MLSCQSRDRVCQDFPLKVGPGKQLNFLEKDGHKGETICPQVKRGSAPQDSLHKPPAGMFFSYARRGSHRRSAVSKWLFRSLLDIHHDPNLDGLFRGNPQK